MTKDSSVRTEQNGAIALLVAAGITGPVRVTNHSRTTDEQPGGHSSWSEVHADRPGNGQIAHCADVEDAELIARLINDILPVGMKSWGPDSTGYPDQPHDFRMPQGGVMLRNGTRAVHPHRWSHVDPDHELHPYDIVFYNAKGSADGIGHD